jgi:hypothetical protein
MTDALGGLEQIEQQTALRVNERTHHQRRPGHKHGWGISPNIARASPSREKKPPAKAPTKAATVAAPTTKKPPSPIGRMIASYDDFVDVCRARADELEISRIELDRITGLADAHSSMLLTKKFMKVFGPVSTGLMLDALGLRLLVVEDPKLTERTLKRRTKRVSTHAHYPRQLPAPHND